MELHFDELEAADDLAVEIIEQEEVEIIEQEAAEDLLVCLLHTEMPELPNFEELDGEDKPEPVTNMPVFDELNELDV